MEIQRSELDLRGGDTDYFQIDIVLHQGLATMGRVDSKGLGRVKPLKGHDPPASIGPNGDVKFTWQTFLRGYGYSSF